MSQHDYNIANATFPNVRSDLNNALGAVATNNAGNSAPSTTYANQWWFDSDGDKLYMRNKDNDAWVEILTIGATSDDVQSLFANVIAEGTSATGVTVDGMLIKDGGFVASKNCVISTTGNETTLEMISTDADASSGPRLSMNRQSGSPADGDDLGKIFFFGKNDAAEDQGYAEILAEISDASDGTEDGRLVFNMRQAGATVEAIRVEGSNGVVVNEGSADVDFRVESNGNANMLFVNGGTDKVGIGTASPQTTLHIEGTAPVIRISDSNSTSEGDATGKIEFYDRNNTDINNSIISGDGSNNDFFITNHNSKSIIFSTNTAEAMRLTNGQQLGMREDSVDVDQGGICMQQGGDDGNIMTFKSSDIAHGFTGLAQTDSYATFGKSSGTDGGLAIQGFHEGQGFGLQLIAHCKTAGYTASNTTGYGHIDIIARGSNGSTSDAALEDNENCMSVRNGGNVKFIVKGNGEIFSDVAANTFDTYEDAQLVRAFDLSKGEKAKGLINSKFDKYIKYNHETLADADLVGREEDGTPNHFVNVTGMQRLHNGAIWQQYEKTERLTQAMYELAKAAVGEDKANEILEQNEIKLLN